MWTTRSSLTATGVILALVLTACSGGTQDATEATDVTDVTAAAEGTTVVATQGALGTFLTDGEGRTLYLFTEDTPGVSSCVDGCLTAWPALLSDGAPVAGMGADVSLLGTITRDDGGVQVTYAGWPLYRYAGDSASGETNGQGVGDVWFAVSPTGDAIALAGDLDEDTSRGGYGSGGSGGEDGDSGDYGY